MEYLRKWDFSGTVLMAPEETITYDVRFQSLKVDLR